MTLDPHEQAPADEISRERLAARGLALRVVDPDDSAAVDAWYHAAARGFLDPERDAEQLARQRKGATGRRRLGVYDDASAIPGRPVGTITSWPTELTVPGGAIVPSWAITGVTVAPTHHRRGIARALMEAELRTAHARGLPMASLTVTESTLYGRYGFGAAADAASWRIDTKRAGWIGPTPEGRLDDIPLDRFRALAPELHERVRRSVPGEILAPATLWAELSGQRGAPDEAAALRAVQYTGTDGVVEGLLLYRAEENPADFSRSVVHVSVLLAGGPDAYAALWRFLLDLDLVGEVQASELSVAEPLRWMIADPRAATVTLRDHHYLRVLDVAAALGARAYGAAGVLALEIADPLGLAGGRWLLRTDADGRGVVSDWADAAAPADAVVVRTGITELSSMYLGSVSLAALAAAGRADASDVAAATRILGWSVPARLSFWY